MMLKIRLHGNEYYLTNGNFDDSPIATAEDYINGIVGYAHIINGEIMRYSKKIGTKEDIEVIGEVEDLEPNIASHITQMITNPLGGIDYMYDEEDED